MKHLQFGEGRQDQDILGFSDPFGEYVPLQEALKAQVRLIFHLI